VPVSQSVTPCPHLPTTNTAKVLYIGIAVTQKPNGKVQYALAQHDGTYCLDYHVGEFPYDSDSDNSNPSSEAGSGAVTPMSMEDVPEELASLIIEKLSTYRTKHLSKPMGAGLTEQVAELSPQLCARLWSELDIVPFVFPRNANSKRDQATMPVDEEADYMARKTVK